MTTLAAQITPAGISVPSYADVLAQVISLFQAIYGTDVVLTPNTQDGQFLALLAQAITDDNQLAAAVYNAFSPTFAQGTGLSSLVKINGIRRNVPTASICVVTVAGVAGTLINNGQVGDDQNLGTVWLLPTLVTIPISGTIDMTATCTTDGAIGMAPGQLSVILTPTLGWQTVTNAGSAVPGAPVENDAALRRRQVASTGGPALTPSEAIFASVANVAGVEDVTLYVNDTGSPDGNGIPEHSISVVVQGGDVNDVGNAIFRKKSEGTGTYGTTSVDVVDQNGVPDTINFFEVAFTDVYAIISVSTGPGYTTAIQNQIVDAVLAYVASLDIGDPVIYFTLAGASTLPGLPQGATFTVEAVTIGTAPSPVGTADIPIVFNHRAQSDSTKVLVVVL